MNNNNNKKRRKKDTKGVLATPSMSSDHVHLHDVQTYINI